MLKTIIICLYLLMPYSISLIRNLLPTITSKTVRNKLVLLSYINSSAKINTRIVNNRKQKMTEYSTNNNGIAEGISQNEKNENNDKNNENENSKSSNLSLINNAQYVVDKMQESSLKIGKERSSVQLVCVSKTKPFENVKTLYDAGFKFFGENYFQELVDKTSLLPSDIKWHFIGHLQSSKAAKLIKLVPNLHCIETVDSFKLASKIDNACEAIGRKKLNIFIQVDTSGEDTKSG